MKLRVQVFIGVPVFSSLGYMPRSGIAGSYVSLFEELPNSFPQYDCIFCSRVCRLSLIDALCNLVLKKGSLEKWKEALNSPKQELKSTASSPVPASTTTTQSTGAWRHSSYPFPSSPRAAGGQAERSHMCI